MGEHAQRHVAVEPRPQSALVIVESNLSLVVAGGVIGVDMLNVRGMQKNRRLSKRVADASLGGFLLKLGYQAEMYGARLIAADQWFPFRALAYPARQIRPRLDRLEQIRNSDSS